MKVISFAARRDSLIIRRILPATVVTVVFVFAFNLYMAAGAASFLQLIKFYGFDETYIELTHKYVPFLDTETILSALRCRRQGIDIFVSNPCDPLGRLFDYSPLWLTAAALPVTKAWTVPVGAGFGSMFIASLLLLPAGRTWLDTAMIVLAVLSTPVAFALERGNCDLVIFALSAGAASLVYQNRRARLAGYGFVILAGLLKYYPLSLISLAVRETVKNFSVLLAAAVLLVAAFAFFERNELGRALALIPSPGPSREVFGAINMPVVVAEMFFHTELSHKAAMYWVASLAAIVLIGGGLTGLSPGLHRDLATLTKEERTFLLVGALLVLSCFFTAQNIGYRAINLILIVPGLSALRGCGRRGYVYGLATALIVLLLWSVSILSWTATTGSRGYGHHIFVGLWFMNEGLWWFTVLLLAQITGSMLFHSQIGQLIATQIGGRTGSLGEKTRFI